MRVADRVACSGHRRHDDAGLRVDRAPVGVEGLRGVRPPRPTRISLTSCCVTAPTDNLIRPGQGLVGPSLGCAASGQQERETRQALAQAAPLRAVQIPSPIQPD